MLRWSSARKRSAAITESMKYRAALDVTLNIPIPCHPEPFACCHAERSEASSLPAQGKLRQGSLHSKILRRRTPQNDEHLLLSLVAVSRLVLHRSSAPPPSLNLNLGLVLTSTSRRSRNQSAISNLQCLRMGGDVKWKRIGIEGSSGQGSSGRDGPRDGNHKPRTRNLEPAVGRREWRAESGRGTWSLSQLLQPANLAPAARDVPKLPEMG